MNALPSGRRPDHYVIVVGNLACIHPFFCVGDIPNCGLVIRKVYLCTTSPRFDSQKSQVVVTERARTKSVG